MKKFLSVLFILGILCSCDMADNSNENDENNQSEKNQQTISQDKLEICPTANETTWVIDYAQEMFAQVGLGDKRIEEMNSVYKDAVLLKIYKEINKRTEEFEAIRQEKYSDISCDITIDGIKKGDVILSKTHGAMLMAVDHETSFHHASLCIKTPESDDDLAFISIVDRNEQIKLISIKQLRLDNEVVVLRCESATDLQIETLTDYALKQIGKNYNLNFIDKLTEESFYCTQLVWAAYREAGIEIDFNANEINDYGVVLATDIYKSPNLKLVKYSD